MYKRLAIVVDTFPRWSERFIARELSELRRRGVELSVFCLKAGTAPVENDREWAGLIERRVVLPACLLPSMPGRREGRYELARKALGPFFRRLGCATKLAELLRAGRFEHVHAHFASLPSTLAWLAACGDPSPLTPLPQGEWGTGSAIPFSMSVHARDLFVDAQLLHEKLLDCVNVFACHARAAEFLKPRDTSKVVLMHHGLPLEQFPYEPRTHAAKDAPEFLAAGRFVPKKGLQYAVEAMADARLAARNVRLVLMGEGPEQKKLERRVKALELDESVRFVPPGDAAAMRNEFRRATALLAPFEAAGDGDADGIPNIILEAFALGVPVIGSNAGSLCDVLTPKTGMVVDGLGQHPAVSSSNPPAVSSSNPPTALADALCEFIDAGPHVNQLRAARKLVERDFDIRKNIEPMLKLLAK